MAVRYEPRNDSLMERRNRVRVGGSGFTVFTWQGKIIAFARQVAHTSPAPVGPGAVPIHPLDEPFPIEVITPAAQGMGTLTLELYELYGQQIWERLGSESYTGNTAGELAGAVDLVDVFVRQAASPNPINMVKWVRPPTLRGRNMEPYTEEYHRVVITNILDGETIEVGTMEVLKQITVAYTYMTRGGGFGGNAANGRRVWRNTNLGKYRDSNSTIFTE